VTSSWSFILQLIKMFSNC